MEKFIGTKIVEAEPAWLVFEQEGEPGEVVVKDHDLELTTAKTVLDGYKVVYEDGYESWSPKAAFRKAYRRTDCMNFGLAIEAAKMGKRIARAGWNGKGMFLYHVPAAAYPPSTEVAKKTFGGENVPYGAYIAMKTAQGNVVPWLASQTDMLADDWYIVEG